ncbi:MAG: hypothetical protein OEY63_03365, partial [Gemmatimonadota bacterium]|nr:hypothetical protein [Gemmatimonadota bacterium]
MNPGTRKRQRPCVFASVALAFMLAGPLSVDSATAQTRGATVTVPYDVNFQTSGQNMFGPGDASPDPVTLDVFSLNWNQSGNASDIQDFWGMKFGGSIGGGTSGDVGMRLVFPEMKNGQVAIDYPVDIMIEVPEPNSFRDGETVSIRTGWQLKDGWSFTTTPTQTTMDFRGSVALSGYASGDLCVFSCTGNFNFFPSFNENDPDIQLMYLSNDPLVESSIPAVVGDIGLPHTFGFAETMIHGIGGMIGLPEVETEATLGYGGTDLFASGTSHYGDLVFDLDSWLKYAGMPPLGVRLDLEGYAGVVFEYQLADYRVNLDLFLDQSFSFHPTLWGTLAFPEPVNWEVVDGDGVIVATGSGNAVTMEMGNTLNVVFPSGKKTPIGSVPTYSLSNTFWTNTQHRNEGDVLGTVGVFELKVPSFSWDEESWTDEGSWVKNCDLIEDWTERQACKVVSWFVGAMEWVSNWVMSLISRASSEINVKTGPLAQAPLEEFGELEHFYPQNPDEPIGFELAGFGSFQEASFLLDPENPIIAIVDHTMESGLLTGGAAGTVLQTLVIENQGDVTLNGTQVADALGTVVAMPDAFQVVSVMSTTLSPNGAFDAAGDPLALAGSDAIAPPSQHMVQVVYQVAPGNKYDALANASGTSPIGTYVEDMSTAAIAVFPLDIIPPRISSRSRGRLPVLILGTEEFSVDQIDPNTIRLEGVAPVKWEFEDENDDGFEDIELKFDRQDVLAGLAARKAAATPPLLSDMLGDGEPLTLLPAASVTDAVAYVLGDRNTLGSGTQHALDLAGNSNGKMDLGDLRALLVSEGVIEQTGQQMTLPGMAIGFDSDDDDYDDDGPVGPTDILIATGSLMDGTFFFVE